MSSAESTLLTIALVVVIVVLAIQLALQLQQRSVLQDWLADPENRKVPEGAGAWEAIYARLYRWRRNDQKERDTLRNMVDQFRLAAQALPDGVTMLNGEGRIDWANAAACEHFSLDVSRDIGVLIKQLVRQHEFEDYLETFLRDRHLDNSIELRTSRDGRERVFWTMLLPFSDSGNLLLSRDVTVVYQTEIMRRDFVANVSHELRTPLTIVCGFLEQFASDTPPSGDAARRFILLMTDQAGRMSRLVSDLLTLSRIENDREPPRDETIDIRSMLESIVTEARTLSNGRHSLVIHECMPIGLRGSSDEIRSAFGNVVTNAVRYTPDGGTITLYWNTDHGKPVFTVRDTGIGISQGDLPRLTERFYRVDKSRSTSTGGTGLGLAIVKHVLVRHGGTLKIGSEIGKGSTFSLSFPESRLVQSSSTASS